MPTLIEDARAVPEALPGPRCSVSRLDPGLRAELAEALASDVDLPRIHLVLRRRGVTMSYETLKRHRRGECMTCRS